MISVVIETRNDEVALAHALAALVPAATEGVVRDVIVVDHGSSDGTLVVADSAGCTILSARLGAGDPLRAAAEAARGDWLLFLPPATVVTPGWQSEAMALIDRAMVAGRARSAVLRFRKGRPSTGVWAGIVGWLERLVGRAPGQATLVGKEAWLASSAPSPASPSASFVSGVRRGAA